MDDSDILVKKQSVCLEPMRHAELKKKVDQQLQDKALINRGIWTVAGKDGKSGSSEC